MTRTEAITEICSTYYCHMNDRCTGNEDWERTKAQLMDALRTLGVTDDELRSEGLIE